MRRQLLPLLPELTRFYRLPPREWDDMTFAEVDAHLEHYRKVRAEEKRQRDEMAASLNEAKRGG